MASITSGSIAEPPLMVYVEVQLTNIWTIQRPSAHEAASRSFWRFPGEAFDYYMR